MIVNIPSQTKSEKRHFMTYYVEECKKGLKPLVVYVTSCTPVARGHLNSVSCC